MMTYRAPDYAGHTPRLYTHPVLLPVPEPMVPPVNPRILRGYVQKLHMTFQHQSPGHTRLYMPCTAMHMDERGRMYPGALASITDLAGTAAAWSLVPRRPGARGATVGMHINYTSTTTGSVVADAHVQQRSEELFFSTVARH
jgi:acyl-coenzyme A thioesterase PaaI-like protein